MYVCVFVCVCVCVWAGWAGVYALATQSNGAWDEAEMLCGRQQSWIA